MSVRTLAISAWITCLACFAGCSSKSSSPMPSDRIADRKSQPQTDGSPPKTTPPQVRPDISQRQTPKDAKVEARPKESGKVAARPPVPPSTPRTEEFQAPPRPQSSDPTPLPSTAARPQISKPTTRHAVDGAYEIVKVFYGTDRATSGTPPDRLRSQHWSIVGASFGAGGGFAALVLVVFAFVGPGWTRKIAATFTGSIVLALGLAGFWIVRFVLSADPVFYGDRPGPLAVGTCEVSIPNTHQAGKMEAPDRLKAEIWDPNKHVMLLDVSPKNWDAFMASLKDVFKSFKSNEKQILVFVHGFNVTFEDAARRTAQMAYDLEFPGVPVFYSWPSKGVLSPAAYEADEAAVDGTVQNLKQFLTTIATDAGADRIHLIAHSMGNRALTAALTAIARDPKWRGKTIFHEVLLTAPDVRDTVFNEVYREMRATAVRTTLYASKEDAALKYAARWVHNEARVGDCSRAMVIKPGMESIDVSDVETDLFGGHWYYAENRHVLSDMKEVLKRKPIDGCDLRNWLKMVQLGPQALYWRFEYR